MGIAGPLVGRLKEKGAVLHNGETVRLNDVSVIRKGQSFAFVMDTRLCDAAFSLANSVDLLVTECTFLGADEDKAQAHGHLTAPQAAKIARKAKAKMLFLTHFSQRYGIYADFAAEARKVFSNIIQMKDKKSYHFPKR